MRLERVRGKQQDRRRGAESASDQVAVTEPPHMAPAELIVPGSVTSWGWLEA